jgi:hypothetical protein
MRHIKVSMILAGAALLGAVAVAQDYGGYRGRGRGDDRYRDYYGDYGRSAYRGGSPVERAMSDLSRAASAGYADRHERGHIDHALRELSKFQDKWRRGKFDRHALDEATENMEHLARADALHPRARDIIARDLYELRDFRGGDDPYRR